jgi:hypothetical protein
MANEVINLNTVFSGFDSGTNLQPANSRTNNQGVKINDIAGFVKIVAQDPSGSAGVKGDMVFSTSTNSLFVCIESYGVGAAVWAAVSLMVQP